MSRRALLPRRRLPAATLIICSIAAPTAALAAFSGSCSDDDPAGATTATGGGGTGAAGGSTTTISSGAGPADAGPDAPLDQYCDGPTPIRPTSVPDDWAAWTCFPGCTFWLAPQDNMPPPIEWEPCEIDHGFECEQMKITWTDDSVPIGGTTKLNTNGQTPTLMFGRIDLKAGDNSFSDILVAELDGDVLFYARRAFSEGGNDCNNVPHDYVDQRLMVQMRIVDTNVDGLMMLDPGETVPRLAYLDPGETVSAWYAGASLIGRGQTPDLALWLHDPDFTYTELMHSPATDPEGLGITGYPSIVGDRVVFTVGSLTRHGVMAHDATGTHDLIRWVGDGTRGAANVATDGVDLVWTQGQGKAPEEWEYPVRDIMVSPFTTDPNELAPVRLRSDPSALMGTTLGRFEVGCGYAMRGAEDPNTQLIVRLSDGQSWRLEGNNNLPNIWKWMNPVGFTCDYALIRVTTPSGINITRVRLDSLGPGMPPD